MCNRFFESDIICQVKKQQFSLSSKKQSSPTYRTVFTQVKTQSLESRHCSILSNFIIVNNVLTLVNYVLAMKGTSEVIEILFAARVIIAVIAVPHLILDWVEILRNSDFFFFEKHQLEDQLLFIKFCRNFLMHLIFLKM